MSFSKLTQLIFLELRKLGGVIVFDVVFVVAAITVVDVAAVVADVVVVDHVSDFYYNARFL